MTLRCPFCNKEFKALGNDFEDDSVYELFCPHCGLVTEPSEFLSDEAIEKGMRLAENYMFELLNRFMNDIDKTFKNNDLIKVKKRPKFKLNDPKSIIESDNMETYRLI